MPNSPIPFFRRTGSSRNFILRVGSCLFLALLVSTCEPLATGWEEVEPAILYTASQRTPPPGVADTVLAMTGNIRYGAARIPWFGDSCGDRVILTEVEVMKKKLA